MPKALPAQPNIDWLKKAAKERLAELRTRNPTARLAEAQRAMAEDYGFRSWRALKARVDSLSFDGRVIAATLAGDAAALAELLDAHPTKLDVTGGEGDRPLLHLAAAGGHVGCVELLLGRGFDVRRRDRMDNATALHWAAQEGHLEVVERLLQAGADLDGEGDDHGLGVLGWATCFAKVQEEVAAHLLARGARLHIFSAIALDRGEDVRAIVRTDPAQLMRRMSRNEHGRLPLHHAASCGRPAMVRLLIELGADVHATDLAGAAAIAYARDGASLEALLAAGARPDLMALLTAGRYEAATAMIEADPARIGAQGSDTIALHRAIDRRDWRAMRWLIEHGADVNAKRSLYDCNATPLHICAERGFADAAAQLLAAGADTTIRDDKFEADALGWAEYCKRPEVARLIRAHRAGKEGQG
jgi:ankyrin repeat protein